MKEVVKEVWGVTYGLKLRVQMGVSQCKQVCRKFARFAMGEEEGNEGRGKLK